MPILKARNMRQHQKMLAFEEYRSRTLEQQKSTVTLPDELVIPESPKGICCPYCDLSIDTFNDKPNPQRSLNSHIAKCKRKDEDQKNI